MIKTTSLETSKALKEAGFRQEDITYWWHDYNVHNDGLSVKNYYLMNEKPTHSGLAKDYAAPTTDELLEELPKDTEICKRLSNYFIVNCEVDAKGPTWLHVRFDNESLPEALAQCWLWLKKEGLLK